MNEKYNLQEKKRAAYKRFAKMGAAGLAVLSLSAFTDISAQQLPPKIEPDSVKGHNLPLVKIRPDTLFTKDKDLLENGKTDTIFREQPYGDQGHNDYGYYNYHNYCNYYNYSNYSNNYSNYTNTYGNYGYSNNYSNGYGNYSNTYSNTYNPQYNL